MSRRVRFGSTTDGTLDALDGQIDTGNENGNNPDNDLVIRDSTGTIVARYNESATTWQLEQPLDLQSNNVTNVGALDVDALESESVSTQELSANNVVIGQETTGDVTIHEGDRVTVSAADRQTIFDVQEAVDVLGGSLIGFRADEITVTWADESTYQLKPGGANMALTESGDRFVAYSIPALKDATKLDFRNQDESEAERDYGWTVWTI